MVLVEFLSNFSRYGRAQIDGVLDLDDFICHDLSLNQTQFMRDPLGPYNREVNFHSFRHSFTDALRRAGYLDEQFGMLFGHTKATTTGI
jgi:integrase